MSEKKLNRITILEGDGIGPEVIRQAVKVLDALRYKYNHDWTYCYADIGASAIDKHGDPFPEMTYNACLESDAILMGAIGDPKYDKDPNAKVRPEQGLLRMRKALGLFANIRPVRVYPSLAYRSPVKEEILKDVDFVVFRELTGGIYFGEKDSGEDYSSDLCRYETHEIERVAHQAYEMASRRKKKLTLIDKANVLESSRLWRKTIQRISEQYPEVTTEYLFVDNAAMQLILNPRQFDVLLCGNLFGDIISDEASVLSGSLGMLPSASRGKEFALYEPVHGSYPQAAGKDIANPMATILSVELMLRDFGLEREANDIKKAIRFCLDNNIGTVDLIDENPSSCSRVGDIVSTMIDYDGSSISWSNYLESLNTIV